MPHRYGGLPGSHAQAAGDEVRARLQALASGVQAHEAELLLAARTDDVLAARFVVLHDLATGGTGPDGGAFVDVPHLREGGVLAGLQELEVWVDATFIIAAVGTWSWTFPRLQTLPTELVILRVGFAYGALHVEVTQVLSLHIAFAAGTLLYQREKHSETHSSWFIARIGLKRFIAARLTARMLQLK